MRIRSSYCRIGGIRRGGIVGTSIHPRIRCGIGVRKFGKNAGKIYYKYK